MTAGSDIYSKLLLIKKAVKVSNEKLWKHAFSLSSFEDYFPLYYEISFLNWVKGAINSNKYGIYYFFNRFIFVQLIMINSFDKQKNDASFNFFTTRLHHRPYKGK